MRQKIRSSFVGLLWFDERYTDIIDAKGVIAFSVRDAIMKQTVLPKGSHGEYKSKRFTTPRARVELNAGIVTLSIGEGCPEYMIEEVIKYFGLGRYRSKLKIVRASFWDKK
ncbi:MAG: hypothetical protein FWE72_00700 [Spirochaetaceae bacterium]|nr:hypothetical protein [Spirochaetaceae bacterium]